MLEIIVANSLTLSLNWVANVKHNLPVSQSAKMISVIEPKPISNELYLVKGKPYESDYSREVERERRRLERDSDRRISGEEYRQEREIDYRYDRNRRQNSIEELEAEKEELERRIEELERRQDSRPRYYLRW